MPSFARVPTRQQAAATCKVLPVSAPASKLCLPCSRECAKPVQARSGASLIREWFGWLCLDTLPEARNDGPTHSICCNSSTASSGNDFLRAALMTAWNLLHRALLWPNAVARLPDMYLDQENRKPYRPIYLACMRRHADTRRHTHKRTHTHTHTNPHRHTHRDAHTHAHTHTHMHMHAQARASALKPTVLHALLPAPATPQAPLSVQLPTFRTLRGVGRSAS